MAAGVFWRLLYGQLIPFSEWVTSLIPVAHDSHTGNAIAFFAYDVPKVLMLLTPIVFVSAGVPLGASFSFLIAGPMVGPVGLGLLFGLAGWRSAAICLVFGFSIAIFIAVVANGLVGSTLPRSDFAGVVDLSASDVRPEPLRALPPTFWSAHRGGERGRSAVFESGTGDDLGKRSRDLLAFYLTGWVAHISKLLITNICGNITC